MILRTDITEAGVFNKPHPAADMVNIRLFIYEMQLEFKVAVLDDMPGKT